MPDTVRETFDQLRQFLKWDITRMLEHKDAGNYAVAVLVAIGCEALVRLQDIKQIEAVFVELMAKHKVSAVMAADVFFALRNGIAHTYDTNFVQSGNVKIELIVSRGAETHASVRRDPPGFVLNVETMWKDLEEKFVELDKAMPRGGALPESWVLYKIYRGHDGAVAHWKQWLAQAEEAKLR